MSLLPYFAQSFTSTHTDKHTHWVDDVHYIALSIYNNLITGWLEIDKKQLTDMARLHCNVQDVQTLLISKVSTID